MKTQLQIPGLGDALGLLDMPSAMAETGAEPAESVVVRGTLLPGVVLEKYEDAKRAVPEWALKPPPVVRSR
jgi:hypothetical protein